MRSLVKLYDMYKAGEYIKEFSDDKMKYLKALDDIPDEARSKLMRIDDKISRKNAMIETVALLILFGLGIALGYMLGFSVAELKEAVQTIAQNATVIP